MFKKLILASIIVGLISLSGLCGEPKAIIQAKATATIGESVWLRTTGSLGKNFQWKVLPPALEENVTILPIFGGMDKDGKPIVSYWAHFSSAKACTVYFLFVATEGDKSDIALHVLSYGGGDTPTPPNPPIPPPDPIVPEIPKPSADIVLLVQPISQLMVNTDKVQLKKDIANLKQFYTDMADTVEKDSTSKIIKTTEHVRQTHINAGKLMFAQTGIKGKYTGLADAINSALATKLGLEIVELSDSKRADAVNVFRGIAWVMQETNKKVSKKGK